jgi:hypothetical protein
MRFSDLKDSASQRELDELRSDGPRCLVSRMAQRVMVALGLCPEPPQFFWAPPFPPPALLG